MVPKLRIVVPVYNEADCLERILLETFEAGYLDRISFVNDASTDDSEAILRRWQETHDIDVLHLRQNRRKEGAIREVLEAMANQEELPPFVCLLDADSIVETGGSSIDELFETALELMEQQDIAGLALRIEARIEPDANVLQKCIYVDYSAVQFDNWITSKQWQLWVINGPGGLFRGDDLLDALRNLTPDFETGDLQISVNLMKQGLRIAFYPDITVRTAVPGTLSAYFQQRRRWERGTTKVLWGDRGFYLGLFRKPCVLPLLLVIHLSLYLGIMLLVVAVPLVPDSVPSMTSQLLYLSMLWYGVNTLKVMTNPHVRRGPYFAFVPAWAIWNGLLWFFVTWIARLVGFVEAISYLAWNQTGRSRNPSLDRETTSGRSIVEPRATLIPVIATNPGLSSNHGGEPRGPRRYPVPQARATVDAPTTSAARSEPNPIWD